MKTFIESQYFVDETFNSITLEIYVKELNHFKKKNYLNRLLLQNSNNLVENDKKSSIDESLSYRRRRTATSSYDA